MSTALPQKGGRPSAVERKVGLRTFERSAKLWSGIVLMLFVTSHFLNHALGIFGIAAMSEVQGWRVAVWRSWPGTILLFGAAIIHISLVLKRVLSRTTWRMPWMEAVQIILGLIIPFVLLGHVVGTRVLSSLVNVDDSYINILRYIWPVNAMFQSTVLLIVWCHGIIGLHYAFHMRRWYRSAKNALMIFAVIIPLLALAGFVAAGREAATSPTALEVWTPTQLAAQSVSMSNGRIAIISVFALVLAGIIFRALKIRFAAHYTVRFTGHGEASGTLGMTLLEISRANNIPHPSTCGGRGRCSSCRVQILEGESTLEKPNDIEQRMLDRIRASTKVRLACQIRPKADMRIRILLEKVEDSAGIGESSDLLEWGVEKDLTILCADTRGFGALAENQLPADLVILVNRIVSEMTQSIEAHGGQIATIKTDGIMAVFGMKQNARVSRKAAIKAAADILNAIDQVNQEIYAALPLPVRVGVGVHGGKVIVSRTDSSAGGLRLVVIGEAVVIANRLEEATKEFVADCVISVQTIAEAGFSQPLTAERRLNYKNGSKPIQVHTFSDYQQLKSAIKAKSADPKLLALSKAD